MGHHSEGSGSHHRDMAETIDRSFLESEVFNGLRVWHISGMIIGAVMIIIISLCCLCKCRIPRTRKEIEANAKRRRDRRKRKKGNYSDDDEATPLTGNDAANGAHERKNIVWSNKLMIYSKISNIFTGKKQKSTKFNILIRKMAFFNKWKP